MELHRESSIDHIVSEEPLSQASLKGDTSVETIQMLAGLAAHVESFAAAVKATHHSVNISSWRKHFLGSMPRGTTSPQLKRLATARCKELGFDPAKHDESDALGILDYWLSVNGVIAPWRMGSILQRQLTPAGDGQRTAA